MKVKWLAVWTLAVLGVSGVCGSGCGVTNVSLCYNNLVHYEGLGFPLYGEDEMELEETCRTMNDSFECVNSFVSACHGNELCDEECQEIIQDIGVFLLNTGVRDLQAELCEPGGLMRQTYLENYPCLEDNADSYASCHNESQLSQEYMSHLTDPHEIVRTRCCFFSWYQDCFTNLTKETCGVNATFFVSFSLHKLVGHIAQYLCKDSGITCDRPPLSRGTDLDVDKPHRPDNDDVDNSLDGYARASSVADRASLISFASTVVYMLLLKRVL